MQCFSAAFEDGDKGPEAKGCMRPLEAGTVKEADSLPSLQKECSVVDSF